MISAPKCWQIYKIQKWLQKSLQVPLISRRKFAKAELNGINLILFHFIVVRERCLTLPIYIRKFTVVKLFYPPKGLCKSRTQWGSFVILSILLCLQKDVWHFQFKGEISLFKILKMFNPQTGLFERKIQWGPFDIQSIFLCLEKGVWHFQFTFGFLPHRNLENILYTDGMGWDGLDTMGWAGISKLSFNYILCRYIEHIWRRTAGSWPNVRFF